MHSISPWRPHPPRRPTAVIAATCTLCRVVDRRSVPPSSSFLPPSIASSISFFALSSTLYSSSSSFTLSTACSVVEPTVCAPSPISPLRSAYAAVPPPASVEHTTSARMPGKIGSRKSPPPPSRGRRSRPLAEAVRVGQLGVGEHAGDRRRQPGSVFIAAGDARARDAARAARAAGSQGQRRQRAAARRRERSKRAR